MRVSKDSQDVFSTSGLVEKSNEIIDSESRNADTNNYRMLTKPEYYERGSQDDDGARLMSEPALRKSLRNVSKVTVITFLGQINKKSLHR